MNHYDCPQCPPGTRPYLIQAGDTYERLAQKFRVSIEALIIANRDANPNFLQIGQSLCIPAPENLASERQCIVGPGNTFYTIARFYNVSLDELLKANPGLDPDRLVIGQIINLPSSVGKNIGAGFRGQPAPGGSNNYIIRPGDTLNSIARQFDTTVATIINANPGIDQQMLQVGQKIYVPTHRNNYCSSVYNLSFLYPANWLRITDDRYEGNDGFFQISPLSGDAKNFEEVCNTEAFQSGRPYGSQPTLKKERLQGQDVAIIMPSIDQPQEMRNQAALVMKSPRTIHLSGRAFYYILLLVEKSFLPEIMRTIDFRVLD